METPYYQDDYVTLYHGDCKEIVPKLGKFDLLLTDPPYGIGVSCGSISKSRESKHTYLTDDDTLGNIKENVVPVVILCLEKCKGRGIITPGPKAFHLYPLCDSFGVFMQPATCSMQKCGRADSQPILYYGRDPMVGKKIQTCSFVLNERPENNGHPCPKPYGAWMKLLQKGCIDGETILDPFAGSGTTGRAAKDLGRKCTLIEREEKYCEIIVKRMQQEVLNFGE